MASNTENVKLGVCRVVFNGNDLGYTKGGVEVMVTTETHKVEVDQFGRSEINEYIMGRTVKVTVPLAETTLENLTRIMPGATLVTTGGVKASGTITFANNPTPDDTVTINGTVFTFKAAVTDPDSQVLIGDTLTLTLDNLVARLNGSIDEDVLEATYTKTSGTVMTVTYDDYGTVGNSFTLAASSDTVSGATLASGANHTAVRVDVTNGIGVSLLDIAEKLVLHPIGNLDTDTTEDFIVPLAATAGALQFAYKLDEERIFNVEFTGYPDPVTKILFKVGDEHAA